MEKKDYPRVLVGSPIYEEKEYCRRKFVQNVKSFTYPNFDFILVDNSKDLKYYTKLKREGLCKVFHTDRGENSRQALATSQNFIREYALKHGFDYWMSVESDLFPPKDTIQKLMVHQKPVVGYPYMIGHEDVTEQDIMFGGIKKTWCVFRYKKTEIGGGTELIPREEADKMMNTGLQKVHGMGVGCALIRRDVLERFKFWYDSRFKNKHSDVYFYLELHNAGVPVMLDTGVTVPHQPSRWELVSDI